MKMKKYLVISSIALVALFCWFYKENNPQYISDKLTSKNKKVDAKVKLLSIVSQLQKTTIPKRVPSSQKMPIKEKRTWKFKDYSRLPAKHTAKKSQKKDHQRIRENIAQIRKEYFSNSDHLDSPSGNLLISKNLNAIIKIRFDEEMGTIYSQANQHIIFKNDKNSSKDNKSINRFDPEGPSMVTYNEDLGKMGILTGKIVVVLHPEQLIDSLSSFYNLEVIYQSVSINTYYLELTQTGDLEIILTGLRANSSVLRADLEVIENIPRAL
jgi:hypothetical protein